MTSIVAYTNQKDEWVKKVEQRFQEVVSEHGPVRRIHMNDYSYHRKLPSDMWRPYRGYTYAGEMIINGQPIEIEIDNRLKDNQIIFEV